MVDKYFISPNTNKAIWFAVDIPESATCALAGEGDDHFFGVFKSFAEAARHARRLSLRAFVCPIKEAEEDQEPDLQPTLPPDPFAFFLRPGKYYSENRSLKVGDLIEAYSEASAKRFPVRVLGIIESGTYGITFHGKKEA